MLNQDDLIRLDAYRIERYQDCNPILQKVGVALSADRRLLLISPPETCDQVAANLPRLKSDAWLILGAAEISLYRGNDLLLVEPTVKSPDKMSDNSPLGKTNMAVATQERKPVKSRASRSTQPQQLDLMLPVLRGLETLAQNTSTPAEAIATQIRDLGHFAGFDPATGSYLSDEPGVDAWLDKWLEDDRVQRKAALLSPVSTTTTPSAEKPVKSPKAAKSPSTLQRKTTTTSTRKTFRDFKKSSKYARTLGNFLDAQNWADTIRIEVIEGIAALSTLPPEPTTLPERALAKIASKYPKAMATNVTAGMIAAAKEIMGTKQPE